MFCLFVVVVVVVVCYCFFFFFFQKQVLTLHVYCLIETICMKCKIMFSWKNEQNIINLSSDELVKKKKKKKKQLAFYINL